MSDFLKKFLLEDARRLSPSGRFVGLAAFGKHPGWDDHVEDLGLETESLNLAKTVLYVNGIGGQIDSGAWEKLDGAQQLAAFNHVFVWQRGGLGAPKAAEGGQILVGRLWSSSDGKGRKRYPLVVCLHFTGVTLGWALKQALPALAELAEGCAKTPSAEDVRALLQRKRAALREAIQAADNRGEYAPVSAEALHKILSPAADAQREGFLRVLYQMQSQLGAFAPGKFNAAAGTVRAQQIRVPLAGGNAEEALLFWTRFLLTQVDAGAPLLLALPLADEESKVQSLKSKVSEAEVPALDVRLETKDFSSPDGWVDATVGEPESHEFFCLRASPKAVPLVSEVPYTLDEAFRAKATAFLSGFQRGETKEADLQTEIIVPKLGHVPAAAKGGWWKWFGVGAVVVVAAIGVVMFSPKSSPPPPDRAASGAESRTSNPERREPASPSIVPAPAATNPAKSEAAQARTRLEAEAEAARLAEEKKKTAALAAAAKLKAEAEDAAQKEKERQAAEATRLALDKQAAAQKEQEEKARLAAEAKAKADEQAKAEKPAVAPAATAPTTALPTGGEMTNSLGMVLVKIANLSGPDKAGWVGKFEVTQAEYLAVMKANPSKSLNDRQPVERVTWNEAREFCVKLTELERERLPAGLAYNLPTQKQWEAARGGQTFKDLPPVPVGRTGPAVVGTAGPANQSGLFDMLGNVWEWCLDGTGGEEKLLKGGAFNSPYYDRPLLPDKSAANCGFRCVLVNKN